MVSSTHEEATVSIGKGAGCATWVVDQENHNRLLPPGCIGELLIEGPIVASEGYLNDERKTAAAFLEDPAWLVRGTEKYPGRCGRVYKTGDLIRYDRGTEGDGRLVFVGRRDTQVKIHGQRVELAEVEHFVGKCLEGVRRVAAEVVTPRKNEGEGEGGRGNAVLVAFVEMETEGTQGQNAAKAEAANNQEQDRGSAGTRASPTSETEDRERKSGHDVQVSTSTNSKTEPNHGATILHFGKGKAGDVLAKYLLRHMRPTAYISLNRNGGSFPMTPTGKVDRIRLREIGAGFSMQDFILSSSRQSNDDVGNESHHGGDWYSEKGKQIERPKKKKRQPRTEIERQMQQIWARVLKIENVESVGVDDNFFDLGGDSIGVMVVVAEARKLGLGLRAGEMFRRPGLSISSISES